MEVYYVIEGMLLVNMWRGEGWVTRYGDTLCVLPSIEHMPSLEQRQAAVQESN